MEKLKGKIICMDHGLKRTGIAISDENLDFAWPVGTVQTEKLKETLQDIVSHEKVSAIVLGLPLMLDGTEGEQCVEVRNFAKELESWFGLPIFFQDERMSTKFNQVFFGTSDDSLAAVTILETFMAKIHNDDGMQGIY